MPVSRVDTPNGTKDDDDQDDVVSDGDEADERPFVAADSRHDDYDEYD